MEEIAMAAPLLRSFLLFYVGRSVCVTVVIGS